MKTLGTYLYQLGFFGYQTSLLALMCQLCCSTFCFKELVNKHHICLPVLSIPGVFPESPRWLLLSERASDMNSFSEHSERQREDDGFTGLFMNTAHHLTSLQ